MASFAACKVGGCRWIANQTGFCDSHDKPCAVCMQLSALQVFIRRHTSEKIVLCNECYCAVYSRAVITSTNKKEITKILESHFDNENAARRAVELVIGAPRVVLPDVGVDHFKPISRRHWI